MPSQLDPLKPLIDQWLAARPKLLSSRVHQDLVRDYGFTGSYDTVRRYIERSRPKPPARPEVRFETAPGFQAQVDWSHEEPIRTSRGLELPLYCFHMALGHSRESFCALTGSFEGRRYHVPDATPGERVELVLGATEIEVHSLTDGRRICRHERGRPAVVLPDPVENSVSLAQVLDAIPKVEVRHRPLSVYQELIDG